jgi:hypothetical protein
MPSLLAAGSGAKRIRRVAVWWFPGWESVAEASMRADRVVPLLGSDRYRGVGGALENFVVEQWKLPGRTAPRLQA